MGSYLGSQQVSMYGLDTDILYHVGGMEVCDIGVALYVDEAKGLRRRLNGSNVIMTENTSAFVAKLKNIVALYPALACTETEWTAIEAASSVGQCGKFVIQDPEEINYYAYSAESIVYFTKSTEDAESVDVYDSEFTSQGTGSIASGVLTYNEVTYNRNSESDAVQETVGYVRLPKIVMPIQGLTDLTKLGELVEAGLPNITGLIGVGFAEAQQAVFNGQGALKEKENLIGLHGGGSVSDKTAGHKGGIELDASSSNDIYGNSTTVQQEQVQYPYFIQIATGQETEVNITNEIELNNPYTLFDSKYSEAPLYNASWLKSSTTYYPKSVYTTAYEALVVENNSEVEAGDSVTLPSGKSYIKRGLSVKLSTAEDITDYDFVINTTDETFRLPQTSNKRSLVDKKEPASSDLSWYNLYSDGWLEQGGIISTSRTSNEPLHGTINLAKAYATTNYIAIGTGIVGGDVIDFESRTNTTLNYWIADRLLNVQVNEQFNWYTAGYADIPAQNLYYYIGETVQNANLINAGRIAETFATKDFATSASAPSENYIDLTLAATNTTYVAPGNGYIYLVKEATAQDQYIYLFSYTSDNPSESKKLGTFVTAPGPGYWTETYLDVKKGDKFVVQYTLGGETHYFRFIYKQGEDMN